MTHATVKRLPEVTYREEAWIQTSSGKHFNVTAPDPHMVNADDIANALGKLCRFGGHTNLHYSVAQHCICVTEQLANHGYSNIVLLQGLLHDATEAYVVDIPSPLKRLLPDYQRIEEGVWCAVAAHFGIPAELHPAVKWADEELLRHEAQKYLEGGPQGWGNPPRTMAPHSLRKSLNWTEASWEYKNLLQQLLGDYYAEQRSNTN